MDIKEIRMHYAFWKGYRRELIRVKIDGKLYPL